MWTEKRHYADECLLLGVKRTWPIAVQMSAFDPKRTFRDGAKAKICLGLSIVVTRSRGRHAATQWKRTAGERAAHDYAQGSQSADCTRIHHRSPRAGRRSHTRTERSA